MKNATRAVLILAAAGMAAGASAGSAFAHGGAQAQGAAVHSPGIASGNLVQAPVHVPANVSGNTANVVGVGNPAFDNYAVNR